ncbi:MAG: alpha/beta hydrolase [Clostridiaceae bacterium]|nr:alpha/beta hydrolase [Clostridiaceae bacterium]
MDEKKKFQYEYPAGMHTLYADNTRPQHPDYYPDVVYVERHRPLTLQIIRQSREGEKNPAIVYVQGSGWQKQKLKQYIAKLVPYARAGYVVVSVEYRYSEEAGFPAQIQDVRTAIRYVKAHAEELGVDPDRIAVMGDSSGGHTALMAGLAYGELFDTPEYGEYTADVGCIIDFYGPTDMSKMFLTEEKSGIIPPEERQKRLLFQKAETYEELREMLQQANPLAYLSPDRDIPPLLIIHGDEDPVVPFSQSVILYEKMRECRKKVEFYNVAGAGHAIGIWIPDIDAVVLRFLRAHL